MLYTVQKFAGIFIFWQMLLSKGINPHSPGWKAETLSSTPTTTTYPIQHLLIVLGMVT